MAMIVDAFAGKLVERLADVIEEKAIMVLGVKEDLQKLRRKMERIARVLKDAEKRKIEDETVKGWVDELKDLMYDADDIIDLCMIQGTGLLQDDDHHSPAEPSATSTRVRCCNFPLLSCVRSVPFRYEIADQIKRLNDRLTEISEDKEKFDFIITSSKSNDAYVRQKASSNLESSFLPESDIVGWDIRDATNSLVDLLVYQHEQKCRLFAIVGMGGIGKTTLAQLIYNDPKINNDFVLHSWICVSKFYTSRADLLKELIRSAGGTCGESTTIADLQKMLCGVLHGKSLFLVLDDVWDADVWINLMKNLIETKTTKCRVLVTTRDRNIATKMGAIHIHNVNKLPLNFGWELLCKKVFTNNDERDIQRLKDVGMKIVGKCDGLPVAIKAIAGVLVTKEQKKREWENVLNSDAWTIAGLPEELQGALYLSYESLPSTLKHCFLYCSLNLLGREFYLYELVSEWIAEGFIEASGNKSMEDVAEGYYVELIRRSFLQPNPLYADIQRCTMHDLLRSLAQFLAGDECFSGDPQEAQNIQSLKKVRRLTITGDMESITIPDFDCLRRLWLWTPPSLNTHGIGSLKHLRILFLNGDKIENIPDSIGDLIHLRLLNLAQTSIRTLPDSLGNLLNLQFLLLDDCKFLHILPNSITKLHNLRWLWLCDTSLNYVPKGIGKLEHLRHLKGFMIGDSGDDGEEGSNLEELQMLENLSHLQIKSLEKASSESAALVLSNKSHLRELHLYCTSNIDGHIQRQEMNNIVQVFDELRPPPCLEDLEIWNFFGGQYPKWMSSTSISIALQELINLDLVDCSNCPQLPPLGQLPQLKYLSIKGATSVVSIGPEFLGHDGESIESAFPKLEYLLFTDMANWEKWSFISGEEDNKPESSKPLFFPHLESISISYCPKLKALPRCLNKTSIQEMTIIGADNLSRISHLPGLKALNVIACLMLECVEKLESLQSLKVIDNQENNTSLPQWLISFLQYHDENLRDNRFMLHLECSAQALYSCLQRHRYWSFLQQVPRFTGYAEDQSIYLKYTKEPYYYETNIKNDEHVDINCLS